MFYYMDLDGVKLQASGHHGFMSLHERGRSCHSPGIWRGVTGGVVSSAEEQVRKIYVYILTVSVNGCLLVNWV
jgi:hypothetical protein